MTCNPWMTDLSIHFILHTNKFKLFGGQYIISWTQMNGCSAEIYYYFKKPDKTTRLFTRKNRSLAYIKDEECLPP
jgi:hypothetical protein